MDGWISIGVSVVALMASGYAAFIAHRQVKELKARDFRLEIRTIRDEIDLLAEGAAELPSTFFDAYRFLAAALGTLNSGVTVKRESEVEAANAEWREIAGSIEGLPSATGNELNRLEYVLAEHRRVRGRLARFRTSWEEKIADLTQQQRENARHVRERIRQRPMS